MKTETHLLVSVAQARELAGKLQAAAANVRAAGGCEHVRQVLEQTDGGPWRLILTIVDEQGD